MKLLKQLFLALLLAPVGAQAGTVDVSITPSNSVVNLSDVFTLDVIGVYTDPLGLSSGAFDFSFNPTVLQVNSVTVNPAINDNPTPFSPTIDNSTGFVSFVNFGSFAGASGNPFTIAQIEFAAVGYGTSPLDFSVGNFGIPAFYDWNEYAGGKAIVNFQNDSVQVGAVPIPAAAWLMLSGAGALGFLGRRRKATTCNS